MDLTYRVSALARISPTIFMLVRISPTLFDGSERASARKTEGKTDFSPKQSLTPLSVSVSYIADTPYLTHSNVDKL